MDIDFSIILIAIASHDALFSCENSWEFKYSFIQPLKKKKQWLLKHIPLY